MLDFNQRAKAYYTCIICLRSFLYLLRRSSENMQKTNFNKKLKQILMEIIGSALVAAAIYNFALNANFPMTGFSGISIILYKVLRLPIGLSSILLNIPVAIVCYRLLGRKFFISSLRCTLISSIFMDYVAPLFPLYEGSRLLAALCTGVIGGTGYTCVRVVRYVAR